jgi:oligosaccharyltransferase complex subunit alpha (ribophorin I)
MDSIGVQSIYPVEEQQFLISRNSMTKDVRSRLVGVPEGIEPAKILGPVSDAEKPAPSDAEPDFELEYGPFSERDSADLATAFVDFTFESVTGLGPTDFAISAMALAGTFRALSAKREVAVSHRGWLQVKEMMTLLNDYPETHPGAWSRLDYLIALQQNSFASRTIQEFLAVIPLAARHIFYRDITGNISTSSLRPLSHLLAPLEQFRKWQTPEGKLVLQSLAAKRDTHQLLALRPRFPLAPSWRTNIEFGYDVPLRGQRYWKSLGGNVFQLRYPLTPPFHGLIIDDLDLKVILPNAARVLHIDTPDDRHLYHISIEHQSGYGHLDFVPRTVVRFRRKNVVTDLSPPTDSQIEIRYTVGSFNAIWLKPLIILGYTVIALAVIVILSRVNFSIQKQ